MQWGASARAAFYYSSTLNGAAFFGCYVLGVVADSGMGYFNSLTIVGFASAATAFGWIGARNNAGVIVWTTIYGFLSGAIQALFSPCVSELSPTPALIGTWNGQYTNSATSCVSWFLTLLKGLCITVVSFAVLSTGPIAGQLLNNTQGVNYIPMQVFTGVCLLIAIALLLRTRFLVSRKVLV